jgi:hypothetical protein
MIENPAEKELLWHKSYCSVLKSQIIPFAPINSIGCMETMLEKIINNFKSSDVSYMYCYANKFCGISELCVIFEQKNLQPRYKEAVKRRKQAVEHLMLESCCMGYYSEVAKMANNYPSSPLLPASPNYFKYANLPENRHLWQIARRETIARQCGKTAGQLDILSWAGVKITHPKPDGRFVSGGDVPMGK